MHRLNKKKFSAINFSVVADAPKSKNSVEYFKILNQMISSNIWYILYTNY